MLEETSKSGIFRINSDDIVNVGEKKKKGIIGKVKTFLSKK